MMNIFGKFLIAVVVITAVAVLIYGGSEDRASIAPTVADTGTYTVIDEKIDDSPIKTQSV